MAAQVASLRQALQAAVAAQNFEQAACLRDRLRALEPGSKPEKEDSP